MRGLIVAAVALASTAYAAGPQWQYQTESTVAPGTPAALTLKSANDVYEIVVELKSGSKTHRFKVPKLAAGQTRRLTWQVPVGVSEWQGTLTGSADGGTTTAPITFKVVSLQPFDVRIDKQDVDLVAGRVVVVPNRAVDRAEVTAFGDGGAKIIDTAATVSVEGDRAVLGFGVPEGVRLARVELKLHDAHGFWAALRIVSWYAEIAHEEVEFETAMWTIRASEAPKIDRAIETLQKEVERFRRELGNDAATVEARVYVAGYTDTVGSAADNQVLSQKRARAIAEYFREHGVKQPIFYQGFGEAVLAVPTPDDTPEAHNRRALYALTNVPPGGPNFPGQRWQRLQ